MTFILDLFSLTPYFVFPIGLVAWITGGTLFIATSWLIWRWRNYHPVWDNRSRWLFGFFLLLVPLTTLFIGIRLPVNESLTTISFLGESLGAPILVFAALPWMLAAGFLGPAPAALLAGVSGLLIGYWETHSLFTPLEYALVAALFGVAVRQRYRTKIFRFLRHPISAAIAVALIYPLIYSYTNILTSGQSLPGGVDFVSSRLLLVATAMSAQLLIGGMFTEVVAMGWPSAWGKNEKLIRSPSEANLESRFLFQLAPFVTPLFALLVIGVWNISGRTAENLIREQMANTAAVSAESIPYVLETGQILIGQIAADERLYTSSGEDLANVLEEYLRSVPYFHQMFVLDDRGQAVGGFPSIDLQSIRLTSQESIGIALALQGVGFQSYSAPPKQGEIAGQITFLAALRDSEGATHGVLVARSGLASNPFTRPMLKSLSRMESLGGQGMLIDADGVILFHPDPDLVMTKYTGILNGQPTFNQEIDPDGTRRLTFNQPVLGRSWSVVTNVPTQQLQQQALEIAIPLLTILFLLALLTFILLRIGLRVVTNSLQELAAQSVRIAAGDLDEPVPYLGKDEIGQLGAAFEEMRLSLKSRMEEINRLLFVSQGVASTLEVDTAVKPILEAALSEGAVSARLVLSPSTSSNFEDDSETNFGIGADTEVYSSLDSQVFELNSRQDFVLLTDPAQSGLEFAPEMPVPGTLLAIALKHEKEYYGSLWAVYKDRHKFSNEERRYFTTLAGQAALAVSNARLYSDAQIGRQHLEAVLSSTSDPVLVSDHKNRLLLANPAAMDLLTDGKRSIVGMPIEEVITKKELLDILLAPSNAPKSAEVSFLNNRVYFASASPVTTEGKSMGRVCVMRDITYLKELDRLKTDFVNGVSHDLRSPLTLMRGYATMLETVGELNTQQSGYVEKIVSGVESMSGLVNNLLDLGRIEAGIGLKLEKVQLFVTASQVIDTLRVNAEQKKITLTLEPSQDTVPLVEADKTFLYQAIQNLIENAINYTPREGKVQVLVAPNPQGVIVEVKDTGIGVAPIDQARIFERFYRVTHEENNKDLGSGLGLAIVKSVAERHGGKVWVESKLGEGSVFTLLIPYHQPAMEAV